MGCGGIAVKKTSRGFDAERTRPRDMLVTCMPEEVNATIQQEDAQA